MWTFSWTVGQGETRHLDTWNGKGWRITYEHRCAGTWSAVCVGFFARGFAAAWVPEQESALSVRLAAESVARIVILGCCKSCKQSEALLDTHVIRGSKDVNAEAYCTELQKEGSLFLDTVNQKYTTSSLHQK